MNILQKFHRTLQSTPGPELALQLTAIFFLFRGFSGPVLLETMITCVCIVMLISKDVLRSSAPWLAIFGLAMLIITLQRSAIDNHKYLMGYWALAVGLAQGEKEEARILQFNARILVGLAFAFAVFWKIFPGEFFDGSFFHLTYLSDGRFKAFTAFVGGLSASDFSSNLKAFSLFRLLPGPDSAAELSSTDTLQQVAVLSSYWTIGIESLIAVSFLALHVRKLEGMRDIFLMIFIATTYFLAPVDRFGMVLTILGLTQSNESRGTLKLTYVYLFLVLQFTRAMGWLNDLLILNFLN